METSGRTVNVPETIQPDQHFFRLSQPQSAIQPPDALQRIPRNFGRGFPLTGTRSPRINNKKNISGNLSSDLREFASPFRGIIRRRAEHESQAIVASALLFDRSVINNSQVQSLSGDRDRLLARCDQIVRCDAAVHRPATAVAQRQKADRGHGARARGVPLPPLYRPCSA